MKLQSGLCKMNFWHYRKNLGMTVVFITHDIRVSDEIGRPGSCDGAGKDRAVRYAGKCKENPADEFVKELIG